MIYLRPNKQLTFNSYNKINFKTAEILLKGIVCEFPSGLTNCHGFSRRKLVRF